MAKSLRKISRREEAAYKALEPQTRGRDKKFEWFRYNESRLRWQDIGYNRSICTSDSFYVSTYRWNQHLPEYVELAEKINTQARIMENALDELNKLREQYINGLLSECSNPDKVHLDYELISEEEEATLNQLRAESKASKE